MWEPIDLDNWQSVPVITGRSALEADIENGIAVFAIPSGSEPHNINLPACVIQTDSENGNRLPGIVIQAEEAQDDVFLGIRYVSGGNGVCTIGEVEFIPEPNDKFCL